MSRVHVIGAGAWGTALAQAAAFAGHEVALFGRDPDSAREVTMTHRLTRYLGDIDLSPSLVAYADYAAFDGADLVLMVVPAQVTRATLEALGPERLVRLPVVLCAKGFEAGTNLRQSQILSAVAPEAEPFVLSGPSFAHDVASGRPTAVTLAGRTIERAEAVASLLASGSFRPYASGDLAGVELCGGLKNVYALGSGAIEGAGLGLSARSAFLARAFAELGRLIGAMGGQEATLGGLAGIGDLALSCTSDASRNYRFGVALGAGASVAEIRARGIGLAEGVYTAPVAEALAQEFGIDAPLVHAVNLALSGAQDISSIVHMLMTRPLKREG